LGRKLNLNNLKDIIIMEYVLVTAMIVGVVELVKRAFDRDFRAVTIIVAAAAVGGLCGVFGIESVSVAQGIVLGLAGSGLVTTATRIG